MADNITCSFSGEGKYFPSYVLASSEAGGVHTIGVSASSTGAQKLTIHRYLDTNGNGTGTKNAVGDYSSVADIFYIQPAAGEVFRISRMLVTIEDANMQWERYGGMTAITNGVQVRVEDDSGTINDLTDGITVKSNVMWGANCFDADLKSAGAGNDYFQVRWTFEKSGQQVRLVGDDNERLEVTLNDSFTGLISHYFKVDGYQEA